MLSTQLPPNQSPLLAGQVPIEEIFKLRTEAIQLTDGTFSGLVTVSGDGNSKEYTIELQGQQFDAGVTQHPSKLVITGEWEWSFFCQFMTEIAKKNL